MSHLSKRSRTLHGRFALGLGAHRAGESHGGKAAGQQLALSASKRQAPPGGTAVHHPVHRRRAAVPSLARRPLVFVDETYPGILIEEHSVVDLETITVHGGRRRRTVPRR